MGGEKGTPGNYCLRMRVISQNSGKAPRNDDVNFLFWNSHSVSSLQVAQLT